MSMDSSEINSPVGRPLSVTEWIVVFLLIGLPVIGFILVLYWSFGDNVNINKKNFSKAMLLLFVVTILLAIIFSLFFGQLLSTMDLNYRLLDIN